MKHDDTTIQKSDSTKIRDADLLEELETHRGKSNFSFMGKHLSRKQYMRDQEASEIAAMTPAKRKAHLTRKKLAEEGANPDDLRHIHSVLAICSLPYKKQPVEVREYIMDQFVSKGMIADLSLHAPDKDGDQRNFHAHILLTMRKVNECGFWTTKTREWNQKPQLMKWKNSWFDAQNRAYARNGVNIRVDPRTLKIQQTEAIKQGDLKKAIALERNPEIHIGRKDWKNKSASFTKNQEITLNNRDAITSFSQKLRAFDAYQTSHIPKSSLRPHSAITTALYHWELAKALYGDYAAPNRPMNYWETLRDLINLIPLEKRSGDFVIPKFDKPPLKSTNKRSTAKYVRPKAQPPPLFSKFDLHDLFKRHADHLTFGEKIRLALSYADAIANIRAGRSHQLQMMEYRQLVRKTHNKAWKRHHKLQLRRYQKR